MISMIVAMSQNGCIGKDGKMPWHIPQELNHFKEYTTHKKIVVGRKTFEGFKQPLKNRFHYVITRQKIDYPYESVQIVHHVDSLIQKYQNSNDELVVIGGKQVYLLFLDVVDKIVLSIIKKEYEGDTYLKEIDFDEFDVISKEEHEEFDVVTFIRKEK